MTSQNTFAFAMAALHFAKQCKGDRDISKWDKTGNKRKFVTHVCFLFVNSFTKKIASSLKRTSDTKYTKAQYSIGSWV